MPLVIKLLKDISYSTSYPLFYPCDPRLLHWQIPRLTDKAPLASCLLPTLCTSSGFLHWFLLWMLLCYCSQRWKNVLASLSKIQIVKDINIDPRKTKTVLPVSLLSQVLDRLSLWLGDLHLTTQGIAHEFRVTNANHRDWSVLIMIRYFLHLKLKLQKHSIFAVLVAIWRTCNTRPQNQATRLPVYSQCSSCPNKPL